MCLDRLSVKHRILRQKALRNHSAEIQRPCSMSLSAQRSCDGISYKRKTMRQSFIADRDDDYDPDTYYNYCTTQT